jgi:hypothetical protein
MLPPDLSKRISQAVQKSQAQEFVKDKLLKDVETLVTYHKNLPPEEYAEKLKYVTSMLHHFSQEFQVVIAQKLHDAGVIEKHTLLSLANARKKKKDKAQRGDDKPSPLKCVLGVIRDTVVEYWHNSSRAYVTVEDGKHFAADDHMFEAWVINLYSKRYEEPPPAEALNRGIAWTESRCLHEGDHHMAHVRVGGFWEGGELLGVYVDLANDKNEAIEIGFTDVKVVKGPLVRFIRTPAIDPLPYPQDSDGNHLAWFAERFGLDDSDYALLLGFLLAALHPLGPYPVLEITGEQGTGKSLLSKFIKMLIDPGKAALRSPAQNERDLMIWAYNSWLICMNNISGINGWLSDALCRLSWDGGFSTRKLYTDNQEIVFDQRRPIVVNGIGTTGAITRRPDLADRSIGIFLNAIPDEDRISEGDLIADFMKHYPFMLSELYSAVSMALRNYKHVELEAKPRMADVAIWVTAGEEALRLPRGSFVNALMKHTALVRAAIFEGDNFARLVYDYLAKFEGPIEVTSSELMEKLSYFLGDKKPPSWWPESADAFGRKLTRIAPLLRQQGIDIYYKRTGSKRVYRISKI